MGVRSLIAVFVLATLLNGGNGSRSDILDNRIVSSLESFRDHMSTGWPEIGIPFLDPLTLPLSDLPQMMDNVVMYGQLTDLTVNKMSDFVISVVESDVLFLKATIELELPLLDVSGSHYGFGSVSEEVTDLTIGVGVIFGKAEEEEEQEENILKVVALDLKYDVTNADVSNVDEKERTEKLLKLLEVSLGPYFKEALKFEINLALQGRGGDHGLTEGPVDDYFDRVFADIRKEVKENGLDPMILPDDSDDFDICLFNITMNGSATIHHGKLEGLSTVHRAGNMTLDFVGSELEVIWGGEVGLIDLQIDYTFSLTLPVWGKDYSISLKMSFVHLSFETDVFILQQDLTLARCNITEFGPVHFKETGAGPLDTPLYELLANAFLGELSVVVMNVAEEVICNLLEKILFSG